MAKTLNVWGHKQKQKRKEKEMQQKYNNYNER